MVGDILGTEGALRIDIVCVGVIQPLVYMCFVHIMRKYIKYMHA
jgi:hypothetical protein